MSRIVARPNHAVSDQQTKWQRVRCAVCVVWCYINNTWREPWSVELRRPYLSQHNNASYHNKLKPVVLFRIFRCFAFSFTLTLFRACIVWLTYFFFFLTHHFQVNSSSFFVSFPISFFGVYRSDPPGCRTIIWDLPRVRYVTLYLRIIYFIPFASVYLSCTWHFYIY